MSLDWISETGLIYDQRLGLGSDRLPQPLRAMLFNGTNQYGWINMDPVTEFPFTIFSWAKGTAGNICGIGSSTSDGRNYNIDIIGPNSVRIQRRNTTQIVTNHSVLSNTNNWNSYAVVFEDSTSYKIYQNGILQDYVTGQTSVGLTTLFNRFNFAVLRSVTPTGYLNGLCMHCGFLRRAITDTEAQDFHNHGFISDAEILLPLDDNSSSVAYNIGLSANNWALEARRNLLSYTESLNILPWVPNLGGSGIVPTVTPVLDPNNELKAFRIDCDRVGDTIDDRSELTITFNIPVDVGTQATGSFWVKASTPSDVGKQIAWRHVGSTNYTSFLLTDQWTRITLTETSAGNGNNWTFGSRGFFNLDAQVSFDVWRPQIEIGSVVTDYQPVLRTGSDFPEATIVNGTSGMIYSGRDVRLSRKNSYGYNTRINRFNNSHNASLWGVSQTGSGTNTTITFPTVFIPGVGEAVAVRAQKVVADGSRGPVFTIPVSPENINTISIYYRVVAGTGPSNLRQSTTPNNGNIGIGHIGVANGWVRVSSSNWNNIANNVWASWSTGTVGSIIEIACVQYQTGAEVTELQRTGSNSGSESLFPSLLINPDKSTAGDLLINKGVCPFDAQAVESNCLTLDGIDDIIGVDLDLIAGPELLGNPGFDTDTVWTKGIGWSIVDGIATYNGVDTASYHKIEQTVSVVPGKPYLAQYNLIRRDGPSSMLLRLDSPNGTILSSETNTVLGVRRHVVIPRANTIRFALQQNLNSGIVEVDNASLRELPASLGPEIRQNGTIGMVGTAPAATYNTTTGQGNISRVDISNQSFVNFTGLTNGLVYSLQVHNTGPESIYIRAGGSGSAIIRTIPVGSSETVLVTVTFNAIFITSSGANATFTLISMNQTGVIEHKGTSLITYNSQGLGITGTAGTAYEIKLGDVEEIPCSEGAGTQVHGVILNRGYGIINHQPSNWSVTQNDFHYNLLHGYTDIPLAEGFDSLGSPLVPIDYIDSEGRAWRAFEFLSNGVLNITKRGFFEYLVIGGGGGGGFASTGGGGGAGGFRTNVLGSQSGGLSLAEPVLFLSNGTYPAIIGAGGSSSKSSSSNGGNSSFADIIAIGGGRGVGGAGSLPSPGFDGGSGGGAGGGLAIGTALGGIGQTGQGFSGGDRTRQYSSGGGGGAGEAGVTVGSNSQGGRGGNGLESGISGIYKFYAGGGGGGGGGGLNFGLGGSGGGGSGGTVNNGIPPIAGQANTGGGGGGAGVWNSGGPFTGAAGGTGIVIVRFRR